MVILMVIQTRGIKERAHADYTPITETQVRSQTTDNTMTHWTFISLLCLLCNHGQGQVLSQDMNFKQMITNWATFNSTNKSSASTITLPRQLSKPGVWVGYPVNNFVS